MAKTSKVHVMSLTRLLAATVIVAALRFGQTSGTMESRCACPGEHLTFECTAIGGVVTIWHGSAFNCNINQPLDEIALNHQRYLSGLSVRGSCNNGHIQAQIIGVDNINHFISQLNVTVSPNMHNKTIECDGENFDGTRVTLSVFRIIVTSEALEGSSLVPITVRLANISQGGILLFEWLDTNSMVCLIDYIILTNCGTCPLITPNTSVTCQADVRGQSRVCQFAVLTQICGRVYGNTSPQFLSITLRGQLDNDIVNVGTSPSAVVPITVTVLSTVICAAVIVCTVICIIVKVKRRKKAAAQRDVQRNQETGAAAVTYEEIGEVQQSSRRIDTTKNVAYCHIKDLKSSK